MDIQWNLNEIINMLFQENPFLKCNLSCVATFLKLYGADAWIFETI